MQHDTHVLYANPQAQSVADKNVVFFPANYLHVNNECVRRVKALMAVKVADSWNTITQRNHKEESCIFSTLHLK